MSRKILRTEQIGPSGHKNEYHIGVLHGNWQEERFALGRKASGPERFEGVSETKSKFPPRECADAKPERSFATEVPRELLFGQSSAMGMKPEDQWVTNSQLSWGVGKNATAKAKNYVGRLDIKGGTSASSTVAPLVPASEILSGSKHLHTVAGEKKRARMQELDDDNTFVTTKQQSLDVTGDRVLRGEVAISPRHGIRGRGGAITNSLNTAANKVQFRK